jgi:N-acetylmuramoyl-L-alanine amidase
VAPCRPRPGREDALTHPVYRLGDHGPAVAQIRDHLARLGLLTSESGRLDPERLDAPFDDEVERAVRAFQQYRGLSADGVVGRETWRRLDDARWRLGDRVMRYGSHHMQSGDDVAALQRRLHELGFDSGRIDGIFGPETERALRDFQRNVGIPIDGLCGPVTFKALDRLARTVVGGDPHLIREAQRLHRGGPGLAGRVIVVDAGHGGADPGAVAHGLREADLVADLAARIEGRLGAVGVTAFLTRGGVGSTTPLSEVERAAFANETDADLLLSLHIDSHASPDAQGVAAFYYGTSGSHGVHSAVGQRFAELLQSEIVERTDLLDNRTDAKTWELLQMTRMPAVRLDLGYLTHASDAARLADAAFRDAIAEAVLVSLQRLYQPTTDVRDTVVELPATVS